MKKNLFRNLIIISFLILFAVFFYRFLSVPLWDYDFWWHIATGRYIVENGHLLDVDPFSYTSELSENKNLYPQFETLVLKNYWLSQIIFYLVYKTFGDPGMIFFRSIVLMLVLIAVWWGLRRDEIKFYIIFLFLFLLSITLLSFTGERPVLFSLLISVLVLLLLDSFKKTRTRAILLLIPLMLLWANLHAGFMIGIITIAAFITGETFDTVLKRTSYTKKEMFIFYFSTISAILVSGINPNGYDTIFYSLSPDFRLLIKGSQEYQSVVFLYWYRIRSIDFDYITLLGLSLIILVSRAKKMDLSRLILLLALTAMSVYALRFMVFHVAIGILLIGREVNCLIENLLVKRMNEKWQSLLPNIFAVFILISSAVFFLGVVKFDWLRFEKAVTHSVPQGAVDFIEKNRIEGNIFNDFGFGGYITWRLYPWKKNFVDTRWLNNTVTKEYQWIYDTVESIRNKKAPEGKLPLWKRLLDHYSVNLILLDTLGIQGGVPPLLLKSIENDEWIPVYADLISVVFIRNTQENQEIIERFKVSKETVYNLLIVRAVKRAIATGSPAYLKDLGDIFAERGMIKDALTAYEYAIKRLPPYHPVRQELERVKNEIESR